MSARETSVRAALASTVVREYLPPERGREAPIDTIERGTKMRSISMRIVVLAVALLIAEPAMTNPPPQPVTLNVNVIGAQGVVRVNGVPVHYFKQQGPKVSKAGNGTFTDASPVLFLSTAYLLLCTNDDNKLAVDAQITDPKGEVHMTLVKSMGAPPLFDRKLTHNGALNYTLPQSGLPEWPWVKADTVADGKSELLKTVAAYQQAFVKKDIAVIDAFERPYFDSVLKMQAMPPGALQEAEHEDAKDIRSAKLQPLAAPDDLLAESYLNGRVVVMDKNHNAPVMLESPDAPGLPWGMGEYWSRIGGKWYVVKRPE
jgi:hypothetical protein